MCTAGWRVMSVAIGAALVGCGGGEDAVPSGAPSVTSGPMEGAPTTQSSLTSTITSEQAAVPSATPSERSSPMEGVPTTRSSLAPTISSEQVPEPTRPGGRPVVSRRPVPRSAPVSPVPTTPRPPPPIPQGREYRTIAHVIETAERGPRIAFSVSTSLPPQVGFGIPLSSWDWDHVEGEERAGGTTWTNELVALVGTWDGAGFVLTEPPTPATRAENEERGRPTRGCETSRWADIADGLFMANVGVFDVAHGGYDGFCGLYIEAVVNSPELARCARATR